MAIRAESYKNAGSTLFKGLEELQNLAQNAAVSAENAAMRGKQGRLDKKEQDRVIKKLDAVNVFINDSAVKDISGFLFPQTDGWEEEIAKKTDDPALRYLEFSARFYRALAEAAAYNLHALGNRLFPIE
jgi:hypothetical protein